MTYITIISIASYETCIISIIDLRVVGVLPQHAVLRSYFWFCSGYTKNKTYIRSPWLRMISSGVQRAIYSTMDLSQGHSHHSCMQGKFPTSTIFPVHAYLSLYSFLNFTKNCIDYMMFLIYKDVMRALDSIVDWITCFAGKIPGFDP